LFEDRPFSVLSLISARLELPNSLIKRTSGGKALFANALSPFLILNRKHAPAIVHHANSDMLAGSQKQPGSGVKGQRSCKRCRKYGTLDAALFCNSKNGRTGGSKSCDFFKEDGSLRED
jgi:hypothetical protein